MLDPKQLRAARHAAGLTLREVGDSARLDPSAIGHYEAGRASPSPSALVRWRAALAGLLQQRSHQISDMLTRL
jgi:transcriptional regulator with XRE-family HTH domain